VLAYARAVGLPTSDRPQTPRKRSSGRYLGAYRSARGLTADAVVVLLYASGCSIIAKVLLDLVGVHGTVRTVVGILVLLMAVAAGVQERAVRARRWRESTRR
jgi:hypothetical protein